MFDFFNKKKEQHSVTHADKEWIEKSILWCIESFGLSHLEPSPFLLPTLEIFPYNNLTEPVQFEGLFEQLCTIWKVNPKEITVKIFDGIQSKQWSTWVLPESFNEPAGLFVQIEPDNEKKYEVQIAKSNFDNPQLLINILAHEIGHVKLIGGGYVNSTDADMEPLTDLATIYFGFGLLLANTSLTHNERWLRRTGYLPHQVIAYTNALLCYITDYDAHSCLQYLNLNTREYFVNDYTYLINTHDTILNKFKVADADRLHNLSNSINDGFVKKDYQSVIDACRVLLAANPNNTITYNNLGYALLQQKQYELAIAAFEKAIDIDPFYDYPINNRGYCRLQLQDFDNAFTDLNHSYEMNPSNSFSLRNLGVYHYMKGEFETALTCLLDAQKIDPKTEMIHFYLSKVYHVLGDMEAANRHASLSKDLDEHNDSIIL